MSDKLVPVRIVIREDQRVFLDEHEEINISGFVRASLDQLMTRYEPHVLGYAICEGRIGKDGRPELVHKPGEL